MPGKTGQVGLVWPARRLSPGNRGDSRDLRRLETRLSRLRTLCSYWEKTTDPFLVSRGFGRASWRYRPGAVGCGVIWCPINSGTNTRGLPMIEQEYLNRRAEWHSIEKRNG